MSARVFNPVVMELRRAMRGGGVGGLGGAPDAAVLAALPTAAADFAFQAPARVRRNLFGPVDHEETRRFVERELAAISKRDEEMYEFDFVRERPRAGPTRRFAWERVRPGGVPESYALRRLAFLGASATATEAATEAATQPAPEDAAAAAQAAAAATATAASHTEAAATPAEPPCTPAPQRVRQAHISDFLRKRKRPSQSAEGKAAPPADAPDAPAPSKLRKAAATGRS